MKKNNLIGKLSLNKETVANLNDQEMKSVKGGATPLIWGGLAISAGIASAIHEYGDNQSWWHCTADTQCCPSEELGCAGIANNGGSRNAGELQLYKAKQNA